MELNTREIDLPEYLSLLGSFGSVGVYHEEPWLRCISEGMGAVIKGLVTSSAAGSIIALSSVMEIKKGPLKLSGSPLRGMYTEFSGLLFSDAVSDELREQALISQHRFLKENGSAYLEWSAKGNIDNTYMRVLGSYGYEYSPRTTLLVDLGVGLDEVWKRFKGRARNMIRKAEKNGVIARVVSPTLSDVSVYYEMLSKTFERQGLATPHPLAFFQALQRNLVPAEQLMFVVAEKDGELIAAAIFVYHNGRMNYLSGTSNYDGGKLGANNLIQWLAIQEAYKLGVREYDLGGTGVDTIDKFKTSFGGGEYSHDRWVRRSLPVKMTEKVYGRLKEKGWVKIHS